jgi:hypothetical protein
MAEMKAKIEKLEQEKKEALQARDEQREVKTEAAPAAVDLSKYISLEDLEKEKAKAALEATEKLLAEIKEKD